MTDKELIAEWKLWKIKNVAWPYLTSDDFYREKQDDFLAFSSPEDKEFVHLIMEQITRIITDDDNSILKARGGYEKILDGSGLIEENRIAEENNRIREENNMKQSKPYIDKYGRMPNPVDRAESRELGEYVYVVEAICTGEWSEPRGFFFEREKAVQAMNEIKKLELSSGHSWFDCFTILEYPFGKVLPSGGIQ